MTKVSWRRILQRAGNDLAVENAPLPLRHPNSLSLAMQRAARFSSAPDIRAAERETELRGPLHEKLEHPAFDAQPAEWDAPIPVPLRRAPQAVLPVAMQAAPTPRRSSAVRSLFAIFLSSAIIAIAVQQIGYQWRSSNAGGGGSGEQPMQAATQPVAVALKPKEPSKLVPTGYMVQPPVNAGAVTGFDTNLETPAAKADGKPPARDAGATEVAAFRQDVEDASKLFESSPPPPLPPRPAAPARRQAPLQSAQEKMLFNRATEMMQRGDVTGARLLFEHLANRDSAIAAFALAQSFDADYLKKINARGLNPDRQQADYWYRRASELACSERAALC